MRTTLKKGTSRSANGNGSGVLPAMPPPPVEPPAGAAAPPPPPGPISRRASYRVRRNPLKLLVKGVLWLVAIALVGAGALAGGVKLYFDHSVSAIRATSPEAIAAAEELVGVTAGKPAVAIVIGYDRRAGDPSSGSRSDTVMLVRVDPDKDAVTLLSFPRDLVVQHPGCEGHPPWVGRINEAYAYCGPRGTVKAVKELTGIPINYMITVNFRAFRNIVDRLDGVYMDVDRRYFNDNSQGGDTYATIDLKPGYQHLNGHDALDFVRYRHTDSDLYRVVRQQEFVKALKQRVSSAWDIFQLPGIVKTVTENIEVAKGGGKPISSGEVLGYANTLYGLPAGNFEQVQLEGLSGYFELQVDSGSLQEAVGQFLNPDVKASEKAINVATGQKSKDTSAPPPPSRTSVEILNGNGEDGAADEVAVLLGQIGYPTDNGGNADNFNYFRTSVLYDPGAKKGEAAAQAVADLFGDAEVRRAPAGKQLPTTLRVIVGKTFQGTLGAATVEETAEKQRPSVVADRSLTPSLRQLRKRASFPILVPTVREEGSSIADDEGIRTYKIDDETAIRLTYQTSRNEYWGIQETSWDEPPILSEPTLERTIGNRTYKLFVSGTKLHVVAFELDGGVYWVVNTLRNSLSNETMLAIAKGLKPLGGQ